MNNLLKLHDLGREAFEVFYRDFHADRLPDFLHLGNVVHRVHLLHVRGIDLM